MVLLSTGGDGARLEWWGPSWRNTTHWVKLKAWVIRLPLLLNIPQKLSPRHSSASMSTLGRFHITSSRRRTSYKSSTKDSPWHQGRSLMRRWEDLSSSLHQLKLSLYSRRSRTMIRGRGPNAYFRFNPRGTSKESCKCRRKTYSKARLTHLCGGWRIWR
jgi:hypothetical protein